LARQYNHTFYDYYSGKDEGSRRYLLDINPWARDRVRGDGNNIIDGRWIDTQNGMFVDITGISEAFPDTEPGVWVCKNEHRYRVKDIFPLRETMFESVVAKVPYEYVAILEEEYSRFALTRTAYEGHRWDPAAKVWVRDPSAAEESIEVM